MVGATELLLVLEVVGATEVLEVLATAALVEALDDVVVTAAAEEELVVDASTAERTRPATRVLMAVVVLAKDCEPVLMMQLPGPLPRG